MAKKSNEIAMVRARLMSVVPDTTPYQRFNPTFSFDNVYVDLPVPASELTTDEKGGIVLTLDGFTAMLSKVTEEMNLTYLHQIKKLAN